MDYCDFLKRKIKLRNMKSGHNKVYYDNTCYYQTVQQQRFTTTLEEHKVGGCVC